LIFKGKKKSKEKLKMHKRIWHRINRIVSWWK
jgi:hypothetical protein